MANQVDQIEKHTIVTRLSVSLYKMTEEQLKDIFELLKQSPGVSENDEDVSALLKQKNPAIQRHMLIARIFILIKQMDKDLLLERLKLYAHPEFRWTREYPRLSCYLMVDFAAQGKANRSFIRDISASGVFIETKDKFVKDQKVALCFSLTESNETLPFKIKGRVSRIYPDGIGVQYENITRYQRDIIDTLIKRI
jgi:hypothetical protein